MKERFRGFEKHEYIVSGGGSKEGRKEGRYRYYCAESRRYLQIQAGRHESSVTRTRRAAPTFRILSQTFFSESRSVGWSLASTPQQQLCRYLREACYYRHTRHMEIQRCGAAGVWYIACTYPVIVCIPIYIVVVVGGERSRIEFKVSGR